MYWKLFIYLFRTSGNCGGLTVPCGPIVLCTHSYNCYKHACINLTSRFSHFLPCHYLRRVFMSFSVRICPSVWVWVVSLIVLLVCYQCVHLGYHSTPCVSDGDNTCWSHSPLEVSPVVISCFLDPRSVKKRTQHTIYTCFLPLIWKLTSLAKT